MTVKAGAVLDRETAASYTLDVEATDGGALFTIQTLTITLNDLNDNTPSITSAAAMAVDENAAAGTLVGTVTASDLDATAPNNTISYAATGGSGFGLFDIDATTGAVTVKSGAVLDFEATPDYTLEVRASDGGTPGRFSTQTLTISLNDLFENALPVITGATNGTVQRDVSLEIPPDAITNGGFETGLNNFPPDLPGWSFGGCAPRLRAGQRPAFGQRRTRHPLRLQYRRADERDPVGLDRRGRALPVGFLAAQQ